VTAHIAGLPVEETLLPWVTGLGAAVLVARTWVASRSRRPRTRRGDRTGDAGS
jgi:hypothetical protein